MELEKAKSESKSEKMEINEKIEKKDDSFLPPPMTSFHMEPPAAVKQATLQL